MNDEYFTIDNEKYHILKLVKYKDKNYIIYEDSNNEIYSSNYEIINNKLVLNDIDDDNIYNHLESILGEYYE